MIRVILVLVFGAAVSPAISAQLVSFLRVQPTLHDGPSVGIAAFGARAELAEDELLVVREVRKWGDGRVELSDAVVVARGMPAEYRVTVKPAGPSGTIVSYLATQDRVPLATAIRTILSDSRLELQFADAGPRSPVSMAWFARVVKVADFQARHPGYTRASPSGSGAFSAGSRFMVKPAE